MKEKIIRNSLFNRLFHPHQIRRNREKLESLLSMLHMHEAATNALEEATSLSDLLEIHKEVYARGYNNKNLSPNPYGMFRTEDILTMSKDEVFLGNIYGLWTNNITFWEKQNNTYKTYNERIEECYEDSYTLVFNQYYLHLSSNIEAMYASGVKLLEEFRNKNYK